LLCRARQFHFLGLDSFLFRLLSSDISIRNINGYREEYHSTEVQNLTVSVTMSEIKLIRRGLVLVEALNNLAIGVSSH